MRSASAAVVRSLCPAGSPPCGSSTTGAGIAAAAPGIPVSFADMRCGMPPSLADPLGRLTVRAGGEFPYGGRRHLPLSPKRNKLPLTSQHRRRLKMANPEDETETRGWLDIELEDDMDEELEQEVDDARVPPELRALLAERTKSTIDRHTYFNELLRLQGELVKLQDWVRYKGLKLVVLFEGRDSAGKGGAIKRIAQRVNPRTCRVVALPAPSDREKTQWYFQRYVPHLPAAGEIVLFDRSWYNRAGVERVMGFANEGQVEDFFRDVPEFERMLVRSGILLVKYWFSITDEEQQLRFLMRIHDPIKQWKLSPMDLQSRVRWEQYTKAKEAMFERTSIPEAPWHIVEGNDKKRARLNLISHLLSVVPYEEVPHEEITLPERVFDPNYERRTLPAELYVPQRY